MRSMWLLFTCGSYTLQSGPDQQQAPPSQFFWLVWPWVDHTCEKGPHCLGTHGDTPMFSHSRAAALYGENF